MGKERIERVVLGGKQGRSNQFWKKSEVSFLEKKRGVVIGLGEKRVFDKNQLIGGDGVAQFSQEKMTADQKQELLSDSKSPSMIIICILK